MASRVSPSDPFMAQKSEAMEVDQTIESHDPDWLDPNDPTNWDPKHGEHIPPPYSFEIVRDNIYADRKPRKQSEDDVDVCVCERPEGRFYGCVAGSCINRDLNIECSKEHCPCGNKCSNQNFQKHNFADVEVFRTKMKGNGLRAKSKISTNSFVMEYCGEILSNGHFRRRARQMAVSGQTHFYFMQLDRGEMLDASKKGNISRFINHSCDPNCETQKWIVEGEQRIGLFSTREIQQGEELTFDYKFENYGGKSQKCYCGAANCRRDLGGNKNKGQQAQQVSILDDISGDEDEDAEGSADEFHKRKRSTKKVIDFFDQSLSTIRGQDGGLLGKKCIAQLFGLVAREDHWENCLKIVDIILATRSPSLLKQIVEGHFVKNIKRWINDAYDSLPKFPMIVASLRVLQHLPLTTSSLTVSKVEDAVKRLSMHSNPEVVQRAESLLSAWEQRKSEQKDAYFIPKLERGADEPHTPIAEPSSAHRNVGYTPANFSRDMPMRVVEKREDSPPPAALDLDGFGTLMRPAFALHQLPAFQDDFQNGGQSNGASEPAPQQPVMTAQQLAMEEIKKKAAADAKERIRREAAAEESERRRRLKEGLSKNKKRKRDASTKKSGKDRSSRKDGDRDSKRSAKELEKKKLAWAKMTDQQKEVYMEKRRKKIEAAKGKARSSKSGRPDKRRSEKKSSSSLKPKRPSATAAGPSEMITIKKFKELMSAVIVARCKQFLDAGKIKTKDDFKHLARKLTHTVVEKEVKAHANLTMESTSKALRMTPEVKKKANKYVESFFAKLTQPYARDER